MRTVVSLRFSRAVPSLALLSALLFPLHPRAAETTNQLSRFEFTEPEMGMPFRFVLYAPDQEIAQAAAQAAFHRVAQLNEIMSDYETDSELNELSRTSGQGKAVPVS